MEKKVIIKDTARKRLNRIFINLVSSNGEEISKWLQEILHTKKPGLRLLYTIFMFSLTIIEEVILLAFLVVYFIIGATAVILYMIFYEGIYEKLISKLKKEAVSSPCYCEWKCSNLNLDCREQ